MKTAISHFENLAPDFSFAEYVRVLNEFASAGAEFMVAWSLMNRALAPDGEAFVRDVLSEMASLGMRFRGAHSFWGPEWDLNQLDPALHETVVQNQKKVIDITGRIGADVVVIHPGDSQFLSGSPDVLSMRMQAIRTLEELLPYAESRGVRISLENIIAPSDSAEENLAILEHFKSDSLVCCYDAGHANVMEAAPGKDPSMVCDYIRHSLWHDGLKLYEGRTLERLAPYVVTAHIHDNGGYADEHRLPGTGSIDWPELIARLAKCPRLEFVQNEVNRRRWDIPAGEAAACFERLFGNETAAAKRQKDRTGT